jgi:hypothetical protein
MTKAMNFVSAMPRFAASAAITARLPLLCWLDAGWLDAGWLDVGGLDAGGPDGGGLDVGGLDAGAPDPGVSLVAMDPHSRAAPAAGSRASSIRSTGMSSRTG